MKFPFIILIVSLSIVLILSSPSCNQSKTNDNSKFNQLNRSNTIFNEDTSLQGRAFDALESNFSDKNSFRLVELVSYNIDSVLNAKITKVHVSLFKYYLEKNPGTFLYAKYHVLNDTVINIYVHNPMAKSDFRQPGAWVDSLLKHAPN